MKQETPPRSRPSEGRLIRQLAFTILIPLSVFACHEENDQDNGVFLADVLVDAPLAANAPQTAQGGADALPTLGSFPQVDMGIDEQQSNESSSQNETENSTCSNQCEPDMVRCEDEITRSVCEDTNGDGCLEWRMVLCPTKQACVDGECEGTNASPNEPSGPSSRPQGGTACDNVKRARLGVNQGATTAPGSFEPLPNNFDCIKGARGADQVWIFTSPVDATYAVTISGSFVDVALHFRIECDEPLSEIACRDDIPFPLGEDVYGLVMGANRSVYIIVDTVDTPLPSNYLMRIFPIE